MHPSIGSGPIILQGKTENQWLESLLCPIFKAIVAGFRGFQLPKKIGHKRRSRPWLENDISFWHWPIFASGRVNGFVLSRTVIYGNYVPLKCCYKPAKDRYKVC